MLNPKSAKHVIETIISMYPVVHSGLDFENPYQLVVACILSAQTTDAAVNTLSPDLFEAFPTPLDLSKASQEEVIPYIKRLGLYKNRSKYLITMAKQLVENFDGEVPQDRKSLMSLSGVGRKCANVILSNAFDIPAFAVDTHVHRICLHHHIAEEDWTPLQIEKRVMAVLPEEEWIHAHKAMIQFGRNICTPKNPSCSDYPELYTELVEE